MDSTLLASALDALKDGPRLPLSEALQSVPSVPGLYGFHADAAGLVELGIETSGPVYVGKAERSLLGRDVRTHFATGKTGSSTLRRSLAGLLREQLSLRAVPRNLARPDGSANFGLAAEGDERLSQWMRTHLTLAVWPRPDGVVLDDAETAVLQQLTPPLNLSKMGSTASVRVKAGRAALALEARAWTPG